MISTLIAISTFLAVTLGIISVGSLMMGVKNEHPNQRRKRSLNLGPLTFLFARLIPSGDSKRQSIKNQMKQAGYLGRHAVDEFLAMRNATIIAWLGAMGGAIYWAQLPQDQLLWPLGAAAAGCAVLYSLPSIALSIQAKQRVERIKYALPDALDMVNMMVTGGLPFMKALERSSEEMTDYHPDIACELAIVNYQANAGSLRQALDEFGKRINEPEVTALSTLVQHADQLGGNVSGAFEDYADSVRRSRRQRAEERGNKASVKLLFPVVFFLAPPIYVLLLGPAALEMRDFLVRQNQAGGVLDQGARLNATRQLEESRNQVEENQ